MRWSTFKTVLKIAVVVTLAGIWLVTMPIGGRFLLERVESPFPSMEVEHCPTADAIAVLGGSGPLRRRVLLPGESPFRIESALELYLARRANTLVLSGAQGEAFRLKLRCDGGSHSPVPRGDTHGGLSRGHGQLRGR